MATNIFQTVGQALGNVAEDMGQKLANERKQEEAIKASSILNTIETEASQRLLKDNETVGINEGYQTDVLPKWLDEVKSKHLNGISNENVIRQINMGLTNFDQKIKLQATSLEIQQRRANNKANFEQLASSVVARININPGDDQHMEELAKVNQLADNMPPDQREEYRLKFSTDVTKAYALARVNQIEQDYGRGFLSAEDVDRDLEKLNRDVVSNEKFLVDSDSRNSLQDMVSDKRVTILKNLRSLNKEFVTKEFTAYLDNYGKGVVDKNEQLEGRMLALTDSELEKDELKENINLTNILRPIQVSLKNGHVKDAEASLTALGTELEAAKTSGDNTRIASANKAYEAGKDLLAAKIAETRKSAGEAMKDDPVLQGYKAAGDVQGQVDHMQRKTAGVVRSDRLKLLNNSELATFTDAINNAANPDEFKDFARRLYANYDKVPVSGTKATAYDLVIQQIAAQEGQNKLLPTVMLYANKNNFDQIAKYAFEKEESSVLKEGDKAKITNKVRTLMADTFKSYQGWDSMAPNMNPADMQFNLATHIALRLRGRATGAGSNDQAAQMAFDMIVKPAQTVVKNSRGAVAVSSVGVSANTIDFLKDRNKQKALTEKLINKHGVNGIIFTKSLIDYRLHDRMDLPEELTLDAAMNTGVWRENKGIFTLMVKFKNGVEYPLPLYRDKVTGAVHNFYVTKEELEMSFPELKRKANSTVRPFRVD
jgi:hypothetical protein